MEYVPSSFLFCLSQHLVLRINSVAVLDADGRRNDTVGASEARSGGSSINVIAIIVPLVVIAANMLLVLLCYFGRKRLIAARGGATVLGSSVSRGADVSRTSATRAESGQSVTSNNL